MIRKNKADSVPSKVDVNGGLEIDVINIFITKLLELL